MVRVSFCVKYSRGVSRILDANGIRNTGENEELFRVSEEAVVARENVRAFPAFLLAARVVRCYKNGRSGVV